MLSHQVLAGKENSSTDSAFADGWWNWTTTPRRKDNKLPCADQLSESTAACSRAYVSAFVTLMAFRRMPDNHVAGFNPEPHSKDAKSSNTSPLLSAPLGTRLVSELTSPKVQRRLALRPADPTPP
mmetsp:Transcript_29946/g.45110  ORF Transcript_29946/g.45110 Transcript_29946/m.45110 type:complete len:125 (+) Transcript_29946:70-444(+)